MHLYKALGAFSSDPHRLGVVSAVQTYTFPVAAVNNLKYKDRCHTKDGGEGNKTTSTN